VAAVLPAAPEAHSALPPEPLAVVSDPGRSNDQR